MNQQIQYCVTSDRVRLAYSVIGKGTPIVLASHWLTHLEYDLKSPVWRHYILGLADRHSLVRYDGRGTGLSQREVPEISFTRWVNDLECVADALSLERFVLLGASQGASISIQYAVSHKERVSHLIIYGGFARGLLYRGDPERQRQLLELNRTMIREGWGSDQEAYRQWFTSQFIPDGTAEHNHWFNQLERISATPDVAERFVVENARINVVDLLPKVAVPTLVLHCIGDARIPFSLGQEIAAGIPGASLVPLEGTNHRFLANEPAHRAFFDAVAAFLGDPPTKRTLPGSTKLRERLENGIKSIEQYWFVKLVIIVAAITGIAIFHAYPVFTHDR